MTTGSLDRRTVLILAAGVLSILVLRFVVMGDKQPAAVTESESVPLAEQRLAKLRETLATVPEKEKTAHQASAELATREKGMILADTAAQAQAQLLEIIRRAGKDEGIDVRGAEEMKVRPLADDYGEVVVAVSFTCRIEQFVNFMTALANRRELLATSDIRVAAANPKEKTVQVRLGLSGVVPRKLVPVKKGPASL
jgi:multidrug efflux pump subunit AcrA (membrane-fusion protein)